MYTFPFPPNVFSLYFPTFERFTLHHPPISPMYECTPLFCSVFAFMYFYAPGPFNLRRPPATGAVRHLKPSRA